MRIPIKAFNAYWLLWFAISAIAIAANVELLLFPLVAAFLIVEVIGIEFTPRDAGTLTDTTGRYVPEDVTFIVMGLFFWRLTYWLDGFLWVLWALGAWLLQHFIRHYAEARH